MDCFFKMFQLEENEYTIQLIMHEFTQEIDKVSSKKHKEYKEEHKIMYGLHYNHSKNFREKQFKEWSEKARRLKYSYTDKQLEEFKIELKNLSDIYYK